MTDSQLQTGRRRHGLTGSSQHLNFENAKWTAPKSVGAGRPRLYTSYTKEQALLNTAAKLWWTVGLIVLAVIAPFFVGRDIVYLMAMAVIYALSGIGLNILTGYTGQISLGHVFFMGVGAYTAAVFGGKPGNTVWGFELDLAIVLPLAIAVPAVLGLLLGPIASRVRGLYLAVLTLGLLMLGEHIFKIATPITGGQGVGRGVAEEILFGIDLGQRFSLGAITFNKDIILYLVSLAFLILGAIVARNIIRSRYGRAFAAVRDKDIAAELMGVSLTRTKTIAFAVSAGYAGLAGALFSILVGRIAPEQWNLLLSINFLAVIFIGGLATVAGTIIGAIFVVMMPKLLEILVPYMPFVTGPGGDGILDIFQLQSILFGVLIIVFIVVEPRGLYGLWMRVRNYFKAWPFSY